MKIYLIASLLDIDPSRWMFCCHYSWVNITWRAFKDFSSIMALKTGALFVKLIDCRKGKSGKKRDTDELNSEWDWSICLHSGHKATKWHSMLMWHQDSQLYQHTHSVFVLKCNVTNANKTNAHLLCKTTTTTYPFKEQLKNMKNRFMQNGNNNELRSITVN